MEAEYIQKRLDFMRQSEGFIFAYVLFIISILFLIITGSITSYQHDTSITDNMLEQVKIETLFQMSHTEFKDALQGHDTLQEDDVFDYDYPYGMVTVSIRKIQDDNVYAHFQITTSKGAEYLYQHTLSNHRA